MDGTPPTQAKKRPNRKKAFESTTERPKALHVDLDGVPARMRAKPHWLLWRYERIPERDGKPGRWAKVPYVARTGRGRPARASTSDPKTWRAFEEAAAAYSTGEWDGIGYVFSKADPEKGIEAADEFLGIDLDDVLDPLTGALEPFAHDLVARFAPTYVEVSPSGTGLKIYALGTLDDAGGNRFDAFGVEMYDRLRFYAVTGVPFAGCAADLADCNDLARKLRAELGAKKSEQEKTGVRRSTTMVPAAHGVAPLTDEEVLDKINASTERGKSIKLKRLLAGDWSGYTSRSEADLALCNNLRFWSRDPDQLKRLVRASGAYRSKWDRDDYADRTIAKAIAGEGPTYDPMRAAVAGERSRRQARRPHEGAGEANGHHNGDAEALAEHPAGEANGKAVAADQAVANGVHQGEELGDELGDVVAGFEPPPPDEGQDDEKGGGQPAGVIIDTDEYRVTKQVTDALRQSDLLFSRDGVVVTPRVPTATTKRRAAGQRQPLEWHRPAALPSLAPAPAALVRHEITRNTFLFKWDSRKKNYAPVHPPDWLVQQVLACPGDLRLVHGLAAGPILREDGSLLNTVGYDEASRLYLARSVDGLDDLIPVRPTLVDAKAAERRIHHVVRQFPWEADVDYARWLALLVTAVTRHFLPRSPLGMLTANMHGSGKTTLANIISQIAHGGDPITMPWPEGSQMMTRGDEVRKRLASLLHEGCTLALMDNLPRGAAVKSAELDGFLTAPVFSDRQLGRNDGVRVGGPNLCLMLMTGNGISPVGDTADRTLLVTLRCDHPNPRSRDVADFEIGDAELHVKTHRRELLADVLTMVRAWIVNGHQSPKGESWGTFQEWVDGPAAVVRYILGIDPIAGRAGQASQHDPEEQALRAVLSQWNRLLGNLPLSAGRIISTLTESNHLPDEDKGLFVECLALLCPPVPGKMIPTPQKLGICLKSFCRRPVLINGETMFIHGQHNNHAKSFEFTVIRRGDAAE